MLSFVTSICKAVAGGVIGLKKSKRERTDGNQKEEIPKTKRFRFRWDDEQSKKERIAMQGKRRDGPMGGEDETTTH